MDNAVTSNQKKVNHKKGIAAAAKAQRRLEAEARKAEHDKMTTAQKLAELDMMCGIGKGGFNERQRLLNPKPTPAPAKKEEPKAEVVAETAHE